MSASRTETVMTRIRRDRAATAAAAVAIVLLAFAASTPREASAQGSIRAWGMGGALTASARGLDAVEFNPANLALSDGTNVGLAGVAGKAELTILAEGKTFQREKRQLIETVAPARLEGVDLERDARAGAMVTLLPHAELLQARGRHYHLYVQQFWSESSRAQSSPGEPLAATSGAF